MNRIGTSFRGLLLLGAVVAIQGCAAETAPSFEAACRAGPGSYERGQILQQWNTRWVRNARLFLADRGGYWGSLIRADLNRDRRLGPRPSASVRRLSNRLAQEWERSSITEVWEREVSMTFAQVGPGAEGLEYVCGQAKGWRRTQNHRGRL